MSCGFLTDQIRGDPYCDIAREYNRDDNCKTRELSLTIRYNNSGK